MAYQFLSYLLVVLLFITTIVGIVAHPTNASAQFETESLQCDGGFSASFEAPASIAVTAGDTVTIPVVISNSFPFTLTDATAILAVYKDGQTTPIDWQVISNIGSLEAGATKAVEVAWSVPKNMSDGTYMVSLFAGQGTNEQLLASTLGNFDALTSMTVQVSSQAEPTTRFLEDQTMVNGTALVPGGVTTFAPEADTLEVAITFANEQVAQAEEGTLSVTVYEGSFPNVQKQVYADQADLRLISGAIETSTHRFSADQDRYLILAQFVSTSGEERKAIYTVARAGTQVAISSAVPRVLTLGVETASRGEATITGCVGRNTYDLADSIDQTERIEMTYRLSVYNLTTEGEKSGSPIVGSEKPIVVGGQAGTRVTFSESVTSLPDEYALVLELQKEGTTIDTREVMVRCENPFTCEVKSTSNEKDVPTFLGISVLSLIQGMQMVIFAILLLIIAIFAGGAYNLLQNKRSRNKIN
jgi:hypothetical protein